MIQKEEVARTSTPTVLLMPFNTVSHCGDCAQPMRDAGIFTVDLTEVSAFNGGREAPEEDEDLLLRWDCCCCCCCCCFLLSFVLFDLFRFPRGCCLFDLGGMIQKIFIWTFVFIVRWQERSESRSFVNQS